MSLEEHRRRERANAIGLFRYQLICPALEDGLSTRQRGRLVREIAERRHIDPFGTQVQIARATLDRWIRRYRGGGFEALVPEPRRLATRTDTQVLELAASLKRENPARTVAQVARILRTATGWAPSESTLLRHFHRCELMGPAAGQSAEVFGRFEAADPNELWVGDALHGPRVGDRKTYLFAFLDDHSRLVVGHRFGFAEDTVRLAAALKPALAARGVPTGIYVDNGSAFVDAWLLRACAKLGIRLVHSAPGRPQGRGKIERFFRTVREQFLVEVTDTTAEDLTAAGVDHTGALLELNRLFMAWVETEYHRRTHSETGQSPLARWETGWDRLGALPALPALRNSECIDELVEDAAVQGLDPVCWTRSFPGMSWGKRDDPTRWQGRITPMSSSAMRSRSTETPRARRLPRSLLSSVSARPRCRRGARPPGCRSGTAGLHRRQRLAVARRPRSRS